ncbi:telomere length and silencing 1 family protein [Sporobolomyces salmoneus]|uniref:telomere length and silencing 1 family protein n=1 Tax=Sporobolomyces salmoneus TaxID=183962 RepID=UPI0031772AB6
MSSDLPVPSTSSTEPAPSFKKKKRPASSSLRSITSSSSVSTPAASGTIGEDNAEEGTEDQTSETLEQLLAIRRLKRTTAGLDLERLNAGEKKKRTKLSSAAGGGGGEGGDQSEGGGEGKRLENGMIEGTNGGLGGKDRFRDDGDGSESKRKIVKSDNFTGQTNTVDVDKHMMAYIEAELAKKRGQDTSSTPASQKPYDPRDELYKVAEKYKFKDVEEKLKGKLEKEEEEGNVTLSTGMLMGIPEVDLGIDAKLKNIEQTEKAKRSLFESQLEQARKAELEREEFAVERFYRHQRPTESDSDALSKARAAVTDGGAMSEAEHEEELRKTRITGGGRRELATDQMALERFKKRQRQQWGK